MNIKYSVIVPTYNRAGLLHENLDALAKQTIPRDKYEVIVVNDGSRDNTDAVVKNFRKDYPEINFFYFKQKNRGVAAARNVGIKNARGEIIFFTDDDCVVPMEWLETLGSAYKTHPEIAGAGGWYKYPEYKKGAFTDYSMRSLYRMYGEEIQSEEINNNLFSRNPAGNTSNMSYRKKVLDEMGGFDEVLTFVGLVDWELKKRIMDIGYPLLYLPYPVVHLKPLGFKEIARKFFNRGRGRYHLVMRSPELKLPYTSTTLKTLYKLRTEPENNVSFKIMALADYFFTKLGWEYQKYTMHRTKLDD